MSLTTLASHVIFPLSTEPCLAPRRVTCDECGWFQIIVAQTTAGARRSFAILGWVAKFEADGMRTRCPECRKGRAHP